MGKLLESLKEYFNNTSKEQLNKDWEEVKYLNEIGPDIINYFMETVKIDKEYQKVIDTLEIVKNKVTHPENKTIEDCQYIIKQLGSRLTLSEDAEAFNDITKNMLKTYIKKNHDYGNSFEQSLNKFGLVAGVVRIGDKMNRIESLTTKESMVKDESIKDTLLDMANYCIMTVMWLNKNKNNKILE